MDFARTNYFYLVSKQGIAGSLLLLPKVDRNGSTVQNLGIARWGNNDQLEKTQIISVHKFPKIKSAISFLR